MKMLSILARLKFVIVTMLMTTSAFATVITDYQYDDQNRLTFVIRSDGTVVEYRYDDVGNRTRKIVTLESVAPTVTTFTVPTTSQSLTVSGIVLTATDNIGVTGYMLNESTTQPAANDPQWLNSSPTKYTFTSEGSKTLYAWAKDAAGNVSQSMTANITVALPQNGACGSANNSNFSVTPSTNLCSIGNNTTVAGSGPWSWNCTGLNGGTTASCSAKLLVNGSCGAANGISFATAPESNLCITGTATSLSGTGPWSWSCNGANGGTVAGCSANLVSNGACGAANGSLTSTTPTTNLCAVGTSSSVSGTGPFTWSCNGANGGSTASCATNNQSWTVTPSAGSGGTISPNTPINVNNSNTAQFSIVPSTGYHIVTVTGCGGTRTGNLYTTGNIIAACTVTATFAADSTSIQNGVCGASNGATLTALPSTNLCSTGSATTVTGSGPWNWSCAGINGGTNASCSASIQSYTLTFASGGNGSISGTASQTVNSGANATSVTAMPATGYSFINWTGNGGFVTTSSNPLVLNNVRSSASVTANFSASPVAGVCGSSNGGLFTLVPATNLCSVGTASTVTGTTTLSWTCSGVNGGVQTSCSATLDLMPPALFVSTLPSGSATNQTPLNISGTVSDINGIATLTVNGNTVAISNAGAYSYPLPLNQEGDVVITVIATDKAGNTASDTRTIKYDTTLPVLTVATPSDNSQTKDALVNISGSISETALVKTRIGSNPWQSAQMNGTSFTSQQTLAPGLNTIEVIAADPAGNSATSIKRTVLYDPNSPSLAITAPSHDIQVNTTVLTVSGTVSDATVTTVKLNFNNTDYPQAVSNGQFSQNLTILAEGSYPVTVTASDAVGNSPTTVTRNIIYTPYPGDSNADGYTSLLPEVLKAFQHTLGQITLTPTEMTRLDCAPLGPDGKPNPNGVVDTADVILLLRKVVGLVNW